jgi:hypothetical protein
MEYYRGKPDTIVQGIEPGSWVWTVLGRKYRQVRGISNARRSNRQHHVAD